MLRVAALVSCALGCGFRPAATSASDAADAPPDLAIDVPREACHDQWLDGSIRFSAPVRFAELSSPYSDRDPYVTPDGLTIYFSSNRADTTNGTNHVYVATRPALDAPFSAPAIFDSASSTASDGKMSMTDDGLYLVVTNTVANDPDLWEARRATPQDTFSALEYTYFGGLIDDGNAQQDPWVSPDAKRIYFALTLSAVQHIALLTRAATDQSFAAAAVVASVDSDLGDADPALSSDERIILFSSHRPLPSFASTNIWFATRATATDPFGVATPVPDLNTNTNAGDPVLSKDECTVYFASVATGNYDIYAATAR